MSAIIFPIYYASNPTKPSERFEQRERGRFGFVSQFLQYNSLDPKSKK